MNKPRKTRQPEGLIGLFGHTYVADERIGRAIQYQFQIIRRMEGDRYVIQYFSFLDGTPSNVDVMTEAELLGPDVWLYANKDIWLANYEKAQRQAQQLRRRFAGGEV